MPKILQSYGTEHRIGEKTKAIPVWISLLVFGVYALQLWSPLRLNTDSMVLLSIASSAVDGHGFLDHGQKTHYPQGYPAMVVCLERIDAGHPWGLVGLNAIFLLTAFLCTKVIARDYFGLSNAWATITVLFTALNFALVKHFTLPLTDIPFFGISLLALWLLVRAEKEFGALYYPFWLAAFAVSALGVLVRPIAIALLPSLGWSLGAHLGLGRALRQRRRLILITFAFAGLLCCAVSVHTKYVQEAMSVVASQGIGHSVRNILAYRVHEVGELFLNAPASKLGKLSALVWFIGAITSVALFMCFRRCRLGIIEVYLAAYTAIMFLWPYGDTRFWIPILPLIFGELFSLLQPWTFAGWKKGCGLLYAAAYMLAGFVALAYSTRITFSGRDFPYRYGDNHLRGAYESFYSDPRGHNSPIDERALELLRRYGN